MSGRPSLCRVSAAGILVIGLVAAGCAAPAPSEQPRHPWVLMLHASCGMCPPPRPDVPYAFLTALDRDGTITGLDFTTVWRGQNVTFAANVTPSDAAEAAALLQSWRRGMPYHDYWDSEVPRVLVVWHLRPSEQDMASVAANITAQMANLSPEGPSGSPALDCAGDQLVLNAPPTQASAWVGCYAKDQPAWVAIDEVMRHLASAVRTSP